MEDFECLLTCSINDVIPILEDIIADEENRNITYNLVVSSSAYAEDIFITITVEDGVSSNKFSSKKYELTRTDKYIGIKEV